MNSSTLSVVSACAMPPDITSIQIARIGPITLDQTLLRLRGMLHPQTDSLFVECVENSG